MCSNIGMFNCVLVAIACASPPCFDSESVNTSLSGSLSLVSSNNNNMHVGSLTDGQSHMVIWADGDIVVEVPTYYESEGSVINDVGGAAGLGRNGIFEDDRLIRASANGSFETLAVISGSDGWSSLTDMNNQGSIVGNYSGGSGSSVWQAFVWRDKHGLEFIAPEASRTYATAIDNNNRVIGYFETDGVYRAMLWENETLIDLSALFNLGDAGNSAAWAFDSAGRVLLSIYNNGLRYIWADIATQEIIDIHQFPSNAYSIRLLPNSNGRIGFSWTYLGDPYIGSWDADSGFESASIGEEFAGLTAIDMNSDGIIGGTVFTLPFYEQEAFLWDGNDIVLLTEQMPKATMSQFVSMTDEGDVLALSNTGYWQLHQRCEGDVDADGAIDVNDLLALISMWGLTSSDPCFPDFDNSGSIDVGDVLRCIANWGMCE